jgi:hypothetical protein
MSHLRALLPFLLHRINPNVEGEQGFVTDGVGVIWGAVDRL